MKEKIIHSIALGLGMALLHGGGLTNLGMMFWSMALAGVTKPLYGAILGGLLTLGLLSGEMLDQGTSPEKAFFIPLIFGIVIAVVGIQCWNLSQKTVAYIKAHHSKLNIYLVTLPSYFSLYFIITIICVSLFAP